MARPQNTFGDAINEKRRLKSLTVKAIYLTVALIVIVLVSLAITISVANSADDTVDDKQSTTASKSELTFSYNDTKKGALLIVNKASAAFNFDINGEDRLVKIADSIPKDSEGEPIYSLYEGVTLADKTALSSFNDMIEDLYDNTTDKDGVKQLIVKSAYRTAAQQSEYALAAGQSDFHTGMLFELEDSKGVISEAMPAFSWLYKNAHKYGFVSRYPDGKSSKTLVGYDFDNAFRYVGVAHATYMYENGLCLEEYVEALRSYTQASPLKINVGGSTYEVFYIEASTTDTVTVSVYSKGKTSVSGDNNGGIIITTKK